MQYPFDVLKTEYSGLLARMQVTRQPQVNATADQLLKFFDHGRYDKVSTATGVLRAWMATSFEREASSNFLCSPAQGDRWDRVSVHVPKGRGPFTSWDAAAIDAYHLDHLDTVGAANWTAERACFEGELFNGFGYRAHGVHSPYLWAGTNNYTVGKYVADGQFDPGHSDTQLGIVPVMVRMIALRPALAFAGAAISTAPAASALAPLAPPASAPQGIGQHADRDTRWVQHALNVLHAAGTPLAEDNNYGRATRRAVWEFQTAHDLQVDGFAGPQTVAALDSVLPQ